MFFIKKTCLSGFAPTLKGVGASAVAHSTALWAMADETPDSARKLRASARRASFSCLIILLSFCLSQAYAQPNASITVTVSLYATNTPSLGMAVASNIMAETAYLGGSVSATNGRPVTGRGVYWGTNSGTVRADGTNYSENGTFDTGDFSFFVTNLPSGRTNYFLAYAANSQGTNFTAESSFLTRPPAPGILPPTNFTANALYANWPSAESSTNYWLDVASTNDFAEYLAGYSNRAAGAELTCAATGLQTRVVYYYRVRSENATGVSTNSMVMTVSAGASGLLPTGLSYSSVYGGENPVAQSFIITNSGYWDFNFTNSAEYSANASGWWLATPATGGLAGVSFLTVIGNVAVTGLNAGTYYVTNTVIAAEATNSPQYLVTTLTVAKADQALTNFTPANDSVFAATNTTGLNATGGGSTNPVTFAVISGPGVISGLTDLRFTNSGTVCVRASQSGDTNWNAAPDMTNTYTYSVLPAAMLGQTITNFMPINSSELVGTKLGLSAQATSLLLVSFAVKSGPGAITGGTNLAFTSTGLVSIVASQAGNTFYDAAPNMTNMFIITAPLSADISVRDMVYLPVNVTNLTTAGTVSFRLGNLGPDPLSSADVAFDFRIGSNDTAMVLLGSAQRTFNLVAGQEQLVILTAQEKRDLVVPATLSGVKQVQVTVRHASTLFDPNLANNKTTAAGMVLVRAAGVNSPARSVNDYDGDGKSDGALWHAGSNLWALCLSGQRYRFVSELNATAGDLPVPGDYDGDGVTDMAIYCHLNGWWWALLSSTEHKQILCGYLIGGPDYTAAQGDFDGDSMTDPAAYCASDGTWYGTASSEGYAIKKGFLGGIGYQPVVADYDGDGIADPAVYNRETGLWVISLSGSNFQIVSGTFGGSGCLPVPADYDGDGKSDPAVYDPGTAYWQVLMSRSLATQGGYTLWDGVLGSGGGIPVPADYDGDGLADPAVYHQDIPSAGSTSSPQAGSGQAGLWELYLSTQRYQLAWGLFGGPEYTPVTE